MARVKVCGICGFHNRVSEDRCQGLLENGKTCDVGIEDIDPEDEESPIAPPPEATQGNPSAEYRPSADSGPPLAAKSTAAAREPRRREAELEFPWGLERIGSRLAIGRDSVFSPLASRLQEFQKVSGVHAELMFDGDRLIVRHLGRTNPTRVNGRPLATGESFEVTDGEELSFSTDLMARVRFV